MERVKVKWIILFILIMCAGFFIHGGDGGPAIKLVEKIILQPEPNQPLYPWSFCVSEDQLFLITDPRAGQVKIYEQYEGGLKLVDKIGEVKGLQPYELLEPTLCFFDKRNGKYGFFDFGRREIYIYDKFGTDFVPVYNVSCPRLGYDINLDESGKSLLISGDIIDSEQKIYSFYSIDLDTGKLTTLLSSFQKYGLESIDQLKGSPDIEMIGRKAWFDVQGEYVYFTWEGSLNIIKLHIPTKKVTSFGLETAHYTKPYLSQAFNKAHREGDFENLKKEWGKMSFVRNLFAGPRLILVIYEGPVKSAERTSHFRIQFYTLDGDFIKDIPIPGQFSYRMFYDDDSNILYSLSSTSSQVGEQYFILKYKILE